MINIYMKKVGIMLGLFVIWWSLFNLLPIVPVTWHGLTDYSGYCTLNWISCYHDIYSNNYPRILNNYVVLILVMFILPAIATVATYKIIRKTAKII